MGAGVPAAPPSRRGTCSAERGLSDDDEPRFRRGAKLDRRFIVYEVASCGLSTESVISDSPFVYGLANGRDSCEILRLEGRDRGVVIGVLDVRRYRGVRLAIPSERISLCIDLMGQLKVNRRPELSVSRRLTFQDQGRGA